MSQAIYKILREIVNLPVPVSLSVREIGTKGNVTLEPLDGNGDLMDGVCPVLELTPQGEIVPNGFADDDRTAIEILREALNVAACPTCGK